MKEKENKQQPNKPSEAIDDLTVNEVEAEEVKGGPDYLKIGWVEGPTIDEKPNPGARTASNPYITAEYTERIP